MYVQIFKDQDYRLKLDSMISLLNATLLEIKYEKPDGTDGVWTGTLHVDNKSVIYDVSAAENNQAGIWKFQLHVEIGVDTFFGSVVTHKILQGI